MGADGLGLGELLVRLKAGVRSSNFTFGIALEVQCQLQRRTAVKVQG